MNSGVMHLHTYFHGILNFIDIKLQNVYRFPNQPMTINKTVLHARIPTYAPEIELLPSSKQYPKVSPYLYLLGNRTQLHQCIEQAQSSSSEKFQKCGGWGKELCMADKGKIKD
jgi:hypothetical protein